MLPAGRLSQRALGGMFGAITPGAPSRKRRTKETLVARIFAAILIAVAILCGSSALAQVRRRRARSVQCARPYRAADDEPEDFALQHRRWISNVFNDPPDRNPKDDFTFTVTPVSDFWLRLGPTWINATLTETTQLVSDMLERAETRTPATRWAGSSRVPACRSEIDGRHPRRPRQARL